MTEYVLLEGDLEEIDEWTMDERNYPTLYGSSPFTIKSDEHPSDPRFCGLCSMTGEATTEYFASMSYFTSIDRRELNSPIDIGGGKFI